MPETRPYPQADDVWYHRKTGRLALVAWVDNCTVFSIGYFYLGRFRFSQGSTFLRHYAKLGGADA